MKAIWNNQIVAESANTIIIENNHYFPPESINPTYFKDSDTTSTCHWKGTANYKTIVVDGVANEDAAWYYANPSALAKGIAGYYAFWKGVKIES
ncbi:MAG: DUF427 domain-containing protein [Allomuricauda sp.]|jgi:uncharacterized protein (DUF427 family)|uniref:DUF427 domain-containing protein n=1 Tax=Flagellimonas sp. MMG031 TaxID=3158549 RepID=A0AAU7MTA2_9FLAO|nr:MULTISPECIES: DUF427 domain-containing protein [unclassified Allomuricauda]MBO6534278.1 DUF427 domain-containing protein [Allomuricauda sp.]MBO6590511.1 DUF427 domain-containing protein [Allomuricauda sp.]MBO6620177.1 DUF427 domain-containing protein [Allomuricauda sp.]MBO6646032.1 DUF427 domain-containing protein [Allomuricauda sp.]MBO6748475.1 DUF427 domain-containing protein [Allomuricauda sp.]